MAICVYTALVKGQSGGYETPAPEQCILVV